MAARELVLMPGPRPTALQLAGLVSLLDAATPAPWEVPELGHHVIAPTVPQDEAVLARGPYGLEAWKFYGGELICETIGYNDASLVAALRNEAPGLIAEIIRLRAELACARSTIASLRR